MQNRLHRERQTKIVATLGPASNTKEMIRALFDAGADMFRLNFSHGTHDDHRARLNLIREIEKEVNHPIPVLADLQGPKLRLGAFAKGSVEIKAGQSFRLDMDKTPGDETRAPLPHPEIFAVLKVGSTLLLDDGKVRLRVTAVGDGFVETVEIGRAHV
jgi:pyruvate kinase